MTQMTQVSVDQCERVQTIADDHRWVKMSENGKQMWRMRADECKRSQMIADECKRLQMSEISDMSTNGHRLSQMSANERKQVQMIVTNESRRVKIGIDDTDEHIWLQMSVNQWNECKRHRWVQMSANNCRWSQMSSNGHRWSQMSKKKKLRINALPRNPPLLQSLVPN